MNRLFGYYHRFYIFKGTARVSKWQPKAKRN
jgi:hypothetical protein